MFGLSYSSQLIQGSALKTWSCVTNFANLIWCKFNHLGLPAMPRSRRRHHSHSRSRSRSHSYDREREPKRRKLDGYESPRHRRSLSFEEGDPSLMRQIRNEDTTQEPFALKSPKSDESQTTSSAFDTENNKNDVLSSELNQTEESFVLRLSENDESQTLSQESQGVNIKDSDSGALEIEKGSKSNENNSGTNRRDSGSDLEPMDLDSENDCSFSKSFLSSTDVAEMKSKIKENILKNHPGKPMSPKNLQKKIESELRKEQRRLEREEKEKKKQELKEEKIRQKQEKEEQRKKELEAKQKEKEKKRKEKEELEEQKRKEREQEKLKKQQEIEEKNKEKQKLEERKQKTAAVFASFFTKKPESVDDSIKKPKEPSENSLFKPFEIKVDMRLAPRIRTEIDDNKKTDLINHLEKQYENSLYLQELKNGKTIGTSPKTWSYEDSDVNNDDVVIIDESPLGQSILQEDNAVKAAKMKAKFLMFHDNRRPAYFGTWRKKSKHIKPRKPLSHDKENLDYEVDSDDDWEDEEDAGEVESLKGSDEEEKEASDNEYEVDNEFFVPHGHLSDDEMNDEEEKPLSPETHKAHLKLMKNEFDEERKSKTMRIKPRILGCVWQNKVKDNVDEAIQKFLEPFTVICVGPIKITKRSAINNQSPNKKSFAPVKLEKEYIPAFLALVHGNIKNRKFLVNEFIAYLKQKGTDFTISKASLSKELQKLAKWTKCPEEGPMMNKLCWFVPENIRKEYQLDLTLPNNWNYIRKDPSD